MNNVHNIDSPFNNIIGLSWYDGLLSGFAKCKECNCGYWFTVLGWDYASKERVYVFMALQDILFDDIVKLLNSLGIPNWPVWVPRWKFSNDFDQQFTERQVEIAINNSGQPIFLINAYDLGIQVINCRYVQHDSTLVTNLMSEIRKEPEPCRITLSRWLTLLKQ